MSYVPIKIVNNIGVPKTKEEFDWQKFSFNAGGIHCIYCALSNDEFNKVSVLLDK